MVVARIITLVVVIGAWQLLPKSLVPDYAISRPAQVASLLVHVVLSGEIIPHLWATTFAVMVGLAIGAPLGIILAVARTVPAIRWFLDPILTSANAVPKVALTTLFILIVGPNVRSHITLVVSFVVFVFYYNMRQALREVDPARLVALRLFGANRIQTLALLILPSAVPYLFAAARVATPLAYGAEVFAELRIQTTYGLGSLLDLYATSLDAAGAMAVMLLVAFIGYALDVVIGNRLNQYADAVGTGVRL